MDPFSFVTPTCSADGYGQAGEQLALAATRHHQADVAVIGHDWADERYCDPAFLALKRDPAEAQNRDTCCIFFLPYGLGHYRGRQITVNMTMFETDRVPDAWARIINDRADGVIVPSEHCREVFQQQVDVPVMTVPFGTDSRFFTVVDREPQDTFTFLMSGLLHYRKGVEFALRALSEEFESTEPVRLVLKTRRGFLDAGAEPGMLHDQRVTIIDEDYTPEQMRDLYHSADAFVACSRGEGSGLTPRDAMATGLPTLLTDWGGLAEIADERYAYPIRLDGLDVAPEENSSYGVGVTGGGPIGNFARPSLAALRQTMRHVYENRDEARQRGLRAAACMRERWTWERCAGEWLRVLERLSVKVPA